MTNVEKLKQLRAKTDAGLAFCKKALEENDWDFDKAFIALNERTVSTDEGKLLNEGTVHSYNHNGRIAVTVEVLCETDFAARSAHFLGFADALCLQIAAMSPGTLDELLSQPWVEDEKQTIGQVLDSLRRVLKEEIRIVAFVRYEFGKPVVVSQ